MKFGKRLKQQIQETLPEWRDKFLSYKELKKLVRSVSSSVPYSDSFAKAEADFVSLLNDEIDKFNAFFMEKEEDFVIRHKELQQRIQRVIELRGPNGAQPCEGDYKEEMSNIRKDTVNFHGEMVLLLNYSNINYIGLAKILKKYDKRTGGLLRSPFIEKVLQQPFFTTDLISKLVKQCESTIDEVFPAEERTTTTTTATCNKISCIEEEEAAAAAAAGTEYDGGEPRVAAAGASLGEGIFRNTVAALLTMKEIRKGSSTYSHFSLPPLNLSPPDRNSSHLTLQRSNLHRPNSPIPITTYSV